MGHKWNLGTWLDNRRKDKKKVVLDKVMETKMTDLGVEWVIINNKHTLLEGDTKLKIIM
jgi:hypothetical protein